MGNRIDEEYERKGMSPEGSYQPQAPPTYPYIEVNAAPGFVGRDAYFVLGPDVKIRLNIMKAEVVVEGGSYPVLKIETMSFKSNISGT